MKKKIKLAVILSGCGVYDGSEIHEAILTLLAIDKLGCTYEVFAPDINQFHVINHLTGEVMSEQRNVLVESARIARGKIKNLQEFNANTFNAIIFPGGSGVAKNLSLYAFDGVNCSINLLVKKAIKSMVELKKPIGALCISPVIMAKVLIGAKVTIGNDKNTAIDIGLMEGNHINTTYGEVIIDKKYKLVTTPCYMLNSTIAQIAEGAENVVKAIIELC